MLFPGHERSRHLLGDLVTKTYITRDQELTNIEREEHRANAWNFELLSSEEQSKVSLSFSSSMQKQDTKEAQSQGRANLDDRWPNGAPPTGPRKHVQHTAAYSRWEPSTTEIGHRPTGHGLSSTWTAQRPPLSQVHGADVSSLGTTRKSDKVINGSVAALWCANDVQRIQSFTHDNSQVFSSVPGEAVVATSTATAKAMKGLTAQIDGTPDTHPHQHVELRNNSLPRCISSLNQTNVLQVPRPERRSLLSATEPLPISIQGLASITSNNPVSETETSITSSPTSALGLHRDIPYARKHSQSCSSEAASVISTASNVAGKSSSLPVSSTLRASVCHVCKKPPFKERLKDCFACSRHYHTGCAEPKDR